MRLKEILEELVERTPGARAAVLADWEGEAVVAYPSGDETDYGTFNVSRETRLFVHDSEGQEHTLRLFGSIIRQNGRSKVFSYIVD